jgi:cold shock CspA family protein
VEGPTKQQEKTIMPETFSGCIKWYNVQKRFGFLVADHNRQDVFFHETNLVDGHIDDGDVVSFEYENTNRGVQASKVKRI